MPLSCSHLPVFRYDLEDPQDNSTLYDGTSMKNIHLGVTLLMIRIIILLKKLKNLSRFLLNLPQTSNSTPHSNSTGRAQTVCASSNDLPTTLAFPNSDNGPLD
mmetsp:Transcript_25049/g.53999  ORF Transcript_25049/g.53999 Transcript_25049/m.53999 type:complete len:103 (+) Transcript_25049:163-471(+)